MKVRSHMRLLELYVSIVGYCPKMFFYVLLRDSMDLLLCRNLSSLSCEFCTLCEIDLYMGKILKRCLLIVDCPPKIFSRNVRPMVLVDLLCYYGSIHEASRLQVAEVHSSLPVRVKPYVSKVGDHVTVVPFRRCAVF
ncbi:hypothetical protein BC832DRAFT_122730 [Gaertneriomyces semiglobifer]|nr:hypothetical protein BC832DRAFT_122730 [Gaertneriomyces semiglobifer]